MWDFTFIESNRKNYNSFNYFIVIIIFFPWRNSP
jgi:hypothetical protein